MIQRLNPYGWLIQAICLGLMLGVIVAGGFYVLERELWPDAPPRVLDASQAIRAGWPAEWED